MNDNRGEFRKRSLEEISASSAECLDDVQHNSKTAATLDAFAGTDARGWRFRRHRFCLARLWIIQSALAERERGAGKRRGRGELAFGTIDLVELTLVRGASRFIGGSQLGWR